VLSHPHVWYQEMMNRLWVALLGAGLWTACGSSEPAASTESPSGDGSDDSSATGAGGTNEAGPAADTSTKSEIDLDAFPIPDGPFAACAVCIRDMCQTELSDCLMDPACEAGVMCTLANCAQLVSGGEAGADALACVAGCFTDVQTALVAVNGLSCVTNNCDVCLPPVDGGGD
jgi:hypothetical protein